MGTGNFETTIGLEVHVEMQTNSKLLSPSPVHYGDEPNENTNVIDFGYPGVLPVANKGAGIRYACGTGVKRNCFTIYSLGP